MEERPGELDESRDRSVLVEGRSLRRHGGQTPHRFREGAGAASLPDLPARHRDRIDAEVPREPSLGLVPVPADVPHVLGRDAGELSHFWLLY